MLDRLQRFLEDAQVRTLKSKGRIRLVAEAKAVQRAMEDLERLRSAYIEALSEQVNSVRVRLITENYASLVDMLKSTRNDPLTEERQEAVRSHIKKWHYESRRWVQGLPLQRCIQHLPARDGLSPQERIVRLKQLWHQAGGASLGPAHPPQSVTMPGAPTRFQLRTLSVPDHWVMEPLDLLTPTGEEGRLRPRWECHPEALIGLLEFAQEALLLEAGGPDRGGKTTFVQRRRRSSLRDAFALSCLQIYEEAVGPKSGRQCQFPGVSEPSSFERFVSLAHEWAIDPEAPPDWALGPDPIRKAIATQRAWQKLMKAARCVNADAFNALPFELQDAAARKLKDKDRMRLIPAAAPLI